MQLPSSLGKQLETQLYQAYLQSVKDCSADFSSAQAQLDWEAEYTRNFKNPDVPQFAIEVWALVSLTSIFVQKTRLSNKIIAYICGETAWDGEHGIALCFENGQHFLGVGDPNGPDVIPHELVKKMVWRSMKQPPSFAAAVAYEGWQACRRRGDFLRERVGWNNRWQVGK